MHFIYNFFLQIPQDNYTSFVIKTGISVILLSLYIVFQAVVNRRKKNRLVMEKKFLQEHFDNQIMHNKLEIQEATFESLGTELHDNIGQLLSTAKMFIGITERSLEKPHVSLLSANTTLDRAITELRDLSKSLNKDWLQQFDLYKNLLADIDRINSAGALQIELIRSSRILPVNAEQQFIFYRLVQEAVQNVIKHAQAKTLCIDISHDENHVFALQEDDGKGFSLSQPQTGLGIKIMKQRINLLKGKINWHSNNLGTKLSIIFPVKKLPV